LENIFLAKSELSACDRDAHQKTFNKLKASIPLDCIKKNKLILIGS